MNALIIGAARSGVAVCELLLTQGYQCTLLDKKIIPNKESLLDKGVTIIEGNHPHALWDENFDLIVKNPGISHHDPFIQGFVDRGHFIFTEVEIAQRYAPHFRYAAISGTNGKTTTTALLEAMLKEKNSKAIACGNIGLPLSSVVLDNPCETRDIAIEMAAFQLLGCQDFHPVVSVILNLSPDHLDVFSSVDEYYQAKCRIYQNQTNDDWFLLNLDDENVVHYAQPKQARVISYSMVMEADACLEEGWVTLFNEKLFQRDQLNLVGEHNLQNAMVAAIMAYKMGVSVTSIQSAIRNFKGVEHRIEYVRTLNSVRYYNDSKGTTAESTVVALKSFEQPVILLAGGYDKKTGFDVLKPVLSKIKVLIAFGATKNQFKDLYPDTHLVETMDDAIALAHSLATENDVVLLSPACASYDQFNNYEERGRRFKDVVSKL